LSDLVGKGFGHPAFLGDSTSEDGTLLRSAGFSLLDRTSSHEVMIPEIELQDNPGTIRCQEPFRPTYDFRKTVAGTFFFMSLNMLTETPWRLRLRLCGLQTVDEEARLQMNQSEPLVGPDSLVVLIRTCTGLVYQGMNTLFNSSEN
jgi:hypothetical protein